MRVLTSAVATLALVASGLVFQAGVNVPGAWAAVSKTSLVLSYDFSSTSTYGGTGTTFTDLSGGGHTGTLVGSAAVTSGAFTSTSATNGTNYATISGGLTGFNAGLTVSFEANLAAIESYERVLSIGDVATNASGLWNNGGDGLWIGRYWNTTELAIEPFNNGVSGGQCRTSGAGVDASFARWTFTITATGLCRVFKNGVEVSTNNNGGANSASGTQLTQLFSGTSQTVNYLGRSHWTADPDLGGSIRWINVYKTALSAAEITDQTTGTVTFDANGGSGTTPSQSSTSATTLASNQFTRSGYTFSGWNSAANGSGTAWGAGATYSFSDDITLYAQWSLNAPTVTTAPSISGTAQTGQTLTATDGSYVSGITPTIASRWQRSSDNTNWTDISGATAGTYTLTDSDVGNYVRYAQTVTNTAGSITSTSAATTMVLSTNSVTGGSGSSSSVGSMFTVPAGSTVYNVTLTSSNLSGNFSFPSAPAGLTLVEGYSTTASYMPTSITGTGSIFSFRGTGDAINTALATLNYNSPSASIDVLKINYAVGSATATDVKNYIPIYDNGQLTYHYYSFTSGLGSLTYSASVSAVAANQFSYGGLTSPNRWYLATTRYAVENAKAVALIPGAQAGAWTSAIGTSGAWTWPANTDGFASAVTFSSGGQSGTNYAQNGLPTYWKDSTQPSVPTGYMGYWQGSNQTQSWATGYSANAYANGIFAETYATAPLSATSSTQTYRSITAPGAPTALAATASGATAASLAWTAPSAGTDPLTDYIVQWSTSSTFASAVTTVTRTASTTASQSITGLTANQTIYLRVAAKSSVTGAWSSTLTYTMPNAEAPSVVGAAAGWVSSTNASVALQWTAPTAYNSATISNYVVERSTDQATWTTVTRTVSTDPSQLVTGLNQATTYYFRVRAVLSSGTGANSSTVTVTTGSAATSLTVVASGGGVAGTDYTVAGGLITPLTSASVSVNAADLQTVLGANGRVWLAADTVTVSNAVTWSADSKLTLGNLTTSTVAINADLTATGTSAGLVIASDACAVNTSTGATASTGCYSLDTKNGVNVTLSGASSTASIAGNAYTVLRTEADIVAITTNSRSGWWYVLGNPITLSTSYTASPINLTYTGKFDGLGNTVNNLTIVNSTNHYGTTNGVGFFRDLGGASVRNVGFTNANISSSTASISQRLGAVAGNGSSAGTNTISQVWATGFITQSATTGAVEAGGLFGGATAGTLNISRSWSSVAVSTRAPSAGSGGIIGTNVSTFSGGAGAGNTLTVDESYSTGNILRVGPPALNWYGNGGIIGVAYGLSTVIRNVFSWGNINSTGAQAGTSTAGIIGIGSGTGYTSVNTAYTVNATCALLTSITNCLTSQTAGSAVSGFATGNWAATNGASLTNLPPPTKNLYVQVTAPTDGSYGTMSYQVVDSTGIVQTLSSLGVTVSGTPVYTITSAAVKGSYNVNYVSGLTLGGTNASVYSLSAWINTTAVTISKYNQTVTWAPTTGIAFAGGAATPDAAPSSTISTTFSYAVSNAGATSCTVNSSTGALSYTASGTCVVTVTGAASGDYLAATSTVSFIIGAPTAAITVVASGGGTLGTDFFVANGSLYGAAGASISVNSADLATALASGSVTLAAATVTVNDAVSWSANSVLKLGLSTASTVSITADLVATGASAGLVIAPASYALAVNAGANVVLSGASATLSIGGTSYTVVNTVAGLNAIATSGSVAITAPIALPSTYTTAINTGTFTGTLDGLGNQINGYRVPSSSASFLGLFASLSSATIRNLGMTNVAMFAANNYAGPFTGKSEGTTTLTQVWSTGTIKTAAGTRSNVALGGLVGYAPAGTLTISKSWSSVGIDTSGSTNSYLAVGGLLGTNNYFATAATGPGAVVSLSEVYSTGSLKVPTATSWWGVGGLIGIVWETGYAVSITNSFSWVSITSDSPNWGGLVGNSSGTVPSVTDSYTTSAYCTSYGNINTSVPSGCKVSINAGANSALTGSSWVGGSTLANVQSPLIPLYVQATFSNSTGSVNDLWYQILDSTGAVVTLSSLNLSISGTIVYSPASMPVSGTAYAVGYDSGLTLGGATASRYSLSNWVSPTSVTISRNVTTLSWSPATALTRLDTGSTLTAPTTNSSATPTYSIAAAGGTGCAITSARVLTFTAAGTCQVKVDYAQVTSYTAASQTVSIVISNAAPLAPTAVTVAGGTATGQLDVSWTAPSTSTTGGTISSYTLEHSTDNATWTAVTGLTGTSTTITGLTNDTPYYVRVKALNATDSLVGAWGTPAGAVKPYWKPTNSVAPTVTGSAVGGLTLTAADGTWGANGNTITSTTYQWQISTDGTNWSNITTDGTAQNYTPLASQAGKYLRAQVTKTNSAGSTTAETAATSAVQSGLADAATLGSVTRGNGQLTVGWTAPSALNGGTISAYKVQYRAGTSGAWTTASSSVSSSATSYTVTGLTNGTGYTVQVIAITAAGDGTAVASSSTVTPATGPSNTGGVNLPAIGGTVAVGRDLTASAGTWADGGDALSYSYQWQSASTSGGSYTDINGATGSTFTVPAGSAGEYFRVVVTATNSVSSSTATSPATIAAATGLAAAPTGITAVAANGQLTVSWTAPTTLNGGVISNYNVSYRATGASSWIAVTRSASTTASQTITGLTNGTAYDLQIEAVTAAGAGAAATYTADTTSTPFTTPVNTVAPSVSGVAAVGRNLTATSGSWTEYGHTSTLTFQWQSSVDGLNGWSNVASGGTGSTYTVTSGDLGTFLRVQVTADNGAGVSGVAESVATAAVLTGLAGAPQSLVVSRQDTALDVTWAAPAALNGGIISAYKIQRSTDGSTWTTVSTSVASSATSFTITGLTNGTGYYVRVLAITAAGDGAAATTVATTTPSTVASNAGGADLPVITGTAAAARTLTASTGTWADGGAAITYSYQWESAATANGSFNAISGATNATYVVDSADVTKFIRVVVTATNAAGAVTATSAVTTVVESGLADAPTGLSATFASTPSLRVNVSWTAPSGLNGASAITGYAVSYATSAAGSYTVASSSIAANATSYAVTGLTAGTTYYFKVAALTAAGTGSLTSASSAVVFGGAPVNTAVPVLTGSLGEGELLSATDGSWNQFGLATTMSYQWERSANGTSGWTPIANATYNSYTLGHDDVDQYVRVVVEASNVVGSTDVAVVAGQIGSAIAAAPTVTATDGNAQVALSWTTPATNGGILRGFIVEQNDGSGWTQLGGQLSTGTTSLTITGLSNAQSYDFRVRALTTLAGLNGTATGRIPYTVPSNTVLPSISGSVAVNETVSANDGSWNGNGRSITSTTYQWQSSNDNGSSWNAINLATNAQYSVPAGLQGQLLRVVVTRVNLAGSTIAVAVGVLVAAGVPTVDTAAALAGTATVGYALTGTDAVFTAHDSAGVTLSGRWEVSANGSTGWTAIAGATSASYTATSAENGKYLRFVSIATNSLNATESASTASAQIASGVPAAPSSVSTTPRDTAIDVTWSALSGAALNGATRSSYRLEWSTDNATWSGTNVSGTSATIAGLSNNTAYFVRVAAVSSVTVTGVFGAASSTTVPFGAPINTALPALTGAQARGYSLSSSAGSWDSNGRSVTATATRWQRSTDSGQTWADISGATSASYTLTASDVGNLVRSVVTATNAFGPTSIESAASGAIGSAAAAAPSNLTVTPGDGQLSLDWDAPTALSGGTIVDYEVQISTDQNTWTTVSHTASTATDLVVTGLSNATGYWVSVAAVTTVTGAPVLSTSATVPFGLPINTALPSISGSERIGDTLTAGMGSWDGNGRLIFQTDYQWQSSADNGTTWTNIAGATGQSYVPSGVLGQLVRVQVTNRNLAGATLASSAATGVIGIGTPGAPTGLTLAPTDLGIAASWTAPSWLADGTVSDYTVELNDGSGWVAVSRGASAVSSQAITGLTLGQSYQVRVRTETGLSSAWTTSGSFTAVGKPSLQVAPAVSGTPLAGSTLSVSSGIWANNGTPLTATTYQWQSSTDGTNWTDIAGAHAATVTATGLRYVRALVTASNAAGFTQTATAPTLWVVTAAPSAPLALNVVPGDQQLAVSWTVPSALGGGSVSDYVVEYSTDGNSWTSVSRTASATPSHTITGLTNGSDYLVRVRAVTSIPGSWVYSTATERPYGHPIYVGSPAPITGTVRFDQTLYANPGAWDWNGSSSSAISYQWQSSSDGGLSWADISGAAGSSYHVIGFVGSKIRVNITATNAAGQSTTTPSAATGPVAAANPSMPLNFTAVPGDQQIALSWTAPASLGGTALVSYVVQTSLDTTTWTTVTRSNATATTETVTGLSNDTPYYVRVRAMTAVTGAWATASGAVVPYGLPINTVLPAVSGTMEFGQTLLASSGSWNENGRVATLSYQWQVKLAGTWTNIAGATSASYQIADYVGSELRAQVTATNLAGPTTASTAATTAVVARPATPVRALSVTLADQALELSWLSPADLGGSTVSDYRVQVKAAGGTWTTVPRTPSTATSQTISGLSNGTDYEVRVQAITTVDGQLASASGLIPRGLPISTGLPAVSGTVQYGSAVSTTVGSWNANGASISAQAIQWQVQLGGSWTNIPGAAGASLSITDYVGSALRARVTSTNAAGSTVAYSAATQAVLADPSSAPTNLTLTPGDQSLTAAWSAPSYVGGDVVVNYLVEISSGGAWTAVARTASTATSQTVSGLTNGTSYSVRVSALTSVTGQASGSASTTPRSLPISTSVPSVSWASPLGTTVSAPQVGRTLTATAGSWNPNGTAITGYGYQWQINTGSGWTSIPGATASSYQPTGNVGATLRVQVTASNVAGGTAAVSTASVPILPAPASVPRTVTVTEADQALQVSWQAPTSTGGSAIANYAVDWSADNGSTWTSVSRLVSTATTQSITSLSNATEYLVRVRALNGVDGEWAVADPATPRGVPIAIGVPGVAGTAQFGATLTAGPGPWNTNGADIDSFTFQWQSSRDGVSWANVPGASGLSYVVGLYVGSRLRVQVTATNEAGSTIAASLPTAVVNAIAAATPQLTSQSVGNAQMTLGWTPPIHSGGVDLTGYTLEYSTDQSSWTSVSTPAATTSATITGLRNGSSYFARVRAETDRSGDWSPVAGPFTPVAPPAPPTAPVVVAPNYDYLRINIMPVAVAGTVLAPLTGSGSITVQPDGRIELAPTQSVALRDGQPIAATVNVTDTGLAVQTETVAVALSFSTGTSSATAEGATTVQAGASAELRGSGFAEGSPVVGWIQSDPKKLGEAVVADGKVVGTFTIPAELEPGAHTIQINGVDASGSVVSIIYGVQVEAAPQVLETIGAGALAEPGALASAWIWWIVAALIVLALLATAYFARRRRS